MTKQTLSENSKYAPKISPLEAKASAKPYGFAEGMAFSYLNYVPAEFLHDQVIVSNKFEKVFEDFVDKMCDMKRDRDDAEKSVGYIPGMVFGYFSQAVALSMLVEKLFF